MLPRRSGAPRQVPRPEWTRAGHSGPLTEYLHAAEEAEAEGLDPAHARGLAGFVEERLALLRAAREARLLDGRVEPG